MRPISAPITSAPKDARPHGRSEVVNALLDAATILFAERGPGAVSLRDVAREANVNLGLIPRYIGGKQDLLSMVLERRPGMPALQPAPPRSVDELAQLLLDLIDADAPYTRIVLRATLDGYDVPRAQQAFPLIERSIAAMGSKLPSPDAELRVGLLAAAALGWQAMAPFLLEIMEQPGLDKQRVTDSLRPALVAFLQADGATR